MSVVAFKEKSRVLAELWLLVAAALFFSSTVSAPALAQTVSFNARLDFAVQTNPISVAVGDLNGDRVQDLAVANSGSNTVSVLLGNGDGTFRAAPTVAAGINPFSVAVGDLNGDGVPDLAVAVGDFNGDFLFDVAVATYISTPFLLVALPSAVSFSARLDFAVQTNPISVAVGDLNGDRVQDLAVANYGSNTVQVLLSNGD